MMRLPSLWLPLVGLVLTCSVGTAAPAQEQSPAEEPPAGGLTGLLGMLSNPALPSLSGLIRPEKMGMLTDNQCRIQDNQPQVLSGNETKVLSDIQILSGFTIQVHVHIHDSAAAPGKDKAAKREAKRDSRQAAQRKRGKGADKR